MISCRVAYTLTKRKTLNTTATDDDSNRSHYIPKRTLLLIRRRHTFTIEKRLELLQHFGRQSREIAGDSLPTTA